MAVSARVLSSNQAAGCIRIGELSRLTSLSPDTLRAYERRGLVKPSGRTRGRFRQYRPDAVNQVRWVQNALALGFTLAELTEFRRDRAKGRPPCRKVRAAAEARLRDLDIELSRLHRLRDALKRAVTSWDEKLANATPDEPLGLLDELGAADMGAMPRLVSRRRFRR